jgi:hypothetical protein
MTLTVLDDRFRALLGSDRYGEAGCTHKSQARGHEFATIGEKG